MYDRADLALIETQCDALEEPGRSLVGGLVSHIRELEAENDDVRDDCAAEIDRTISESEAECDELRRKVDKLEDSIEGYRSDFRNAERDLSKAQEEILELADAKNYAERKRQELEDKLDTLRLALE